MAGSLGSPVVFNVHACLAAYTNILRRNLNTTCITSNCGMWRHGSGANQL